MKKLLLFIAVTIFSSMAIAAKPIKFGTGGPTGNYFSMANDIDHYCSDQLVDRSLEILNTKGSIDNLRGMGSKKYSIGWVQEDVLHYYARQDPTKVNKNRLKIIAGGHAETVHMLIPKDYNPTPASSGWMDKVGGMFSSKEQLPLDLNLLKGQTIGSYGGSLVSAKALSMFMELDLTIVEIPEERRGKAGDVPILLVGGQPYAPVEQYLATNNYVLVSIDARTLSTKAPFYMESTANYEVNGEIVSIPTIGVRALMIGKSFRKESKNANMIALAGCIDSNLEDLADDSDTNPNWASVVELDEAGQTNWSYFPLK